MNTYSTVVIQPLKGGGRLVGLGAGGVGVKLGKRLFKLSKGLKLSERLGDEWVGLYEGILKLDK